MHLTAEALQARVLYRDEAMLVLDKPYGIAVHGGPKGGVTLDDFLPALTFGKASLPQLAHRLDRETTGCLVLGRDKPALQRLGALFAKGLVKKTYFALVCGVPRARSGDIDLALARKSHDKRSWWMKVDPSGDASLTRYHVLAEAEGLSFMALRPETGRTHQLRVHCAAMGFPIAGDRIYGGDRAMAASHALMLHAGRLVIPFFHKQQPLEVTAALPAAMSIYLAGLGIAVSHADLQAQDDFGSRS